MGCTVVSLCDCPVGTELGGVPIVLEFVVDTFLANDSFPPTITEAIIPEAWGGGGGGLAATGSGGGAEYARLNTYPVIAGVPVAIVVGVGGPATGADGGNTTLAATDLIASGGTGGSGGGTGGTGGTGDVTFNGGDGGVGAGTVGSGASAGSTGPGVNNDPGDPNGACGNGAAAAMTGGGGGRSTAVGAVAGGGGMMRFTYHEEAVTGFSRQVGFGEGRDPAATTSRNIIIPAEAQPGDLAVVIWGCNGAPTNTMTGWTSMASAAHVSNVKIEGFKRILTGADPVAIVTSASELGNWHVRVYRGAIDAEAVAVGTQGTNATSPMINPSWGIDDYVIGSAVVWDSSVGPTITSFPTSYGHRVLTPGKSINGVALASCARRVTGGTETPGNFVASFEQYGGITYAIRPG